MHIIDLPLHNIILSIALVPLGHRNEILYQGVMIHYACQIMCFQVR